MGNPSEVGSRSGRELFGWFLLFLGAGALQLPALGRMAMHDVDILEFEFMFSTTEAIRTVGMLGSEGVSAARQQLFVDFGYLLIYASLLWKGCRMLGVRAARTGPAWVAKLASTFAWAGVVAAVCDAVENVCLLLVTYGHTSQPWPALAGGYAAAKFILLGITVLFVLLGLLTTFSGQRPGPADAEPALEG